MNLCSESKSDYPENSQHVFQQKYEVFSGFIERRCEKVRSGEEQECEIFLNAVKRKKGSPVRRPLAIKICSSNYSPGATFISFNCAGVRFNAFCPATIDTGELQIAKPFPERVIPNR